MWKERFRFSTASWKLYNLGLKALFIFFFYAFLPHFQDSTSLPVILVLEESEINDEKAKEEARVSVENFLQVKDTRAADVCWQMNTW